MRAMVLTAQAKIDTQPLRGTELPLPEPGPGEIRVTSKRRGATLPGSGSRGG